MRTCRGAIFGHWKKMLPHRPARLDPEQQVSLHNEHGSNSTAAHSLSKQGVDCSMACQEGYEHVAHPERRRRGDGLQEMERRALPLSLNPPPPLPTRPPGIGDEGLPLGPLTGRPSEAFGHSSMRNGHEGTNSGYHGEEVRTSPFEGPVGASEWPSPANSERDYWSDSFPYSTSSTYYSYSSSSSPDSPFPDRNPSSGDPYPLDLPLPFKAEPNLKGSFVSPAPSSNSRTGRSTTCREDFGFNELKPKPEALEDPFEDPPPTYNELWWRRLPKWAFLRSSTSLPTLHLGPGNLLHGSSRLRYELSLDEKTDSGDSEDEWWESDSETEEIAKAGVVYPKG